MLVDPTRFTVVSEAGAWTYARRTLEPIAELVGEPASASARLVTAGQDGDVLAILHTEIRVDLGLARLWMRCTVLPPAP